MKKFPLQKSLLVQVWRLQASPGFWLIAPRLRSCRRLDQLSRITVYDIVSKPVLQENHRLLCSSRYASLFETPISLAILFSAAFSSSFSSAMICSSR